MRRKAPRDDRGIAAGRCAPYASQARAVQRREDQGYVMRRPPSSARCSLRLHGRRARCLRAAPQPPGEAPRRSRGGNRPRPAPIRPAAADPGDLGRPVLVGPVRAVSRPLHRRARAVAAGCGVSLGLSEPRRDRDLPGPLDHPHRRPPGAHRDHRQHLVRPGPDPRARRRSIAPRTRPRRRPTRATMSPRRCTSRSRRSANGSRRPARRTATSRFRARIAAR